MKQARARKTRTYRTAILALVLVCVALIVHEIYGENGYFALRRQKKEYKALQQEIRKLQEENQQLEKRVESLRSDPRAIEGVARDQLHMARPGERIYTLPEKDSKSQAASAAEYSKPKP